MKITQLVAKPQLIDYVLDDEAIVKKYGEAIVFYSYDRQPIDVFMKLASATESNVTNIISIVKDLILDEKGSPILTADNMLPTDVLMAAIGKITQSLGN
jgi:hypothetical protein